AAFRNQQAQTDAARADVDRAEAARQKDLADQSERERQREMRIQKVYRVRLGSHSPGWAEDAWEPARAAARIRPSKELRDLASTVLRGSDAHKARSFKGFVCPSLAFDTTGRRVVLAGWGKDEARYWDGGIAEPVLSG